MLVLLAAPEAFAALLPLGSRSVMMFTTATAPLGIVLAAAAELFRAAELLLLADLLPAAAVGPPGAAPGLLPQGPWETTLTS